MVEPLTEEQYEPIRAALFDGPGGQGAIAAKRRIAENLQEAGFRIVKIEPGACGDPGCAVLHADPANPIHPPGYPS